MSPQSHRPAGSNTIQPRLRVFHGKEIALGPGKADLLEALDQTGTITEAARRLGMSYMRAWNLIQAVNRCFKQPLVDTSRGGSVHGGAHLTETGRQVLALYRTMETRTRAALAPAWEELLPLLREISSDEVSDSPRAAVRPGRRKSVS